MWARVQEHSGPHGAVSLGGRALMGVPGSALPGVPPCLCLPRAQKSFGPLLAVRGHPLMPSIGIIKGCISGGKIQPKEHAPLNAEIQNFIAICWI